jgi:hypothetical protein
MRIEYEITPEDWVAFGEFCVRASPGYRRLVRLGAAVGVLGVLWGAATAWGLLGKPSGWLVAGVVFTTNRDRASFEGCLASVHLR